MAIKNIQHLMDGGGSYFFELNEREPTQWNPWGENHLGILTNGGFSIFYESLEIPGNYPRPEYVLKGTTYRDDTLIGELGIDGGGGGVVHRDRIIKPSKKDCEKYIPKATARIREIISESINVKVIGVDEE